MVTYLHEAICNWDFMGCPGCEPRPRNNLLVGTQESNDAMMLYQPEGISCRDICAGRTTYSQDVALGHVRIQWQIDVPDFAGCEKAFLIGVSQTFEDGQPVWIVDEGTLVIPLGGSDHSCLHMLELFAGGYGGWHVASRLLQHRCNLPCKVVGIEVDPVAAYQHAVSHACAVVPIDCMIPSGLLAASPLDFLLLGDIRVDHWLPAVAQWRPNCVVISSPCPPWSSAGQGAGLNTEEGRLFLRAIQVCKILRPSFIGIEQVAGFAGHEHKWVILDLLRWAGFSVQWCKTVDAAGQSPVTRSRWLCIAKRIADEGVLATNFQFWTPMSECVPDSYGSVMPFGLFAQDPRLDLTCEAREKASRHDLLPPPKRRLVEPGKTLLSRCYDDHTKLPTFMAAYGHQHAISEELLKHRGLMSHFHLTVNGAVKLWHPIEVLFLHGAFGDQLVSNDWQVAFSQLGNQIMTVHALLVLANIVNRLPLPCEAIDVAALFQDFQHLHLRFDSPGIQFQPLEFGIFVTQKKLLSFTQVEQVGSRLQNLFAPIPTGMAWTSNGLVNLKDLAQDCLREECVSVDDSPVIVSPTVAFQPLRRVLCCFPGFEFAFKCSWNLDILRVLGLWDHAWSLQEESGDERCDVKITLNTQSPVQQVPAAAHQIFLYKGHDGIIVLDSPDTLLGLSLYDQFESVQNVDGMSDRFYSETKPFVPGVFQGTALAVVAAMTACQCHFVFVPSKLLHRLSLSGPAHATALLADFWTHIRPADFLDFCGLVCTRRAVATDFHLDFQYQASVCPIPHECIWQYLFALAVKALLSKVASDEGMKVTLKCWNRPVWSGRIKGEWTLEVFEMALQAVGSCFGAGEHFRILSAGKQQPLDMQIQNCPRFAHHQELRLHAVYTLKGGGVSTKTGNKIQHKNAIATALLEEGYELAWISATIDKIADQIGGKELAQVVALPKGPAQVNAILKLIQANSIEIPKISPVKTSQHALNAKKRREPTRIDPADFNLLPDTLCNEDGSPAQATTDFCCQATGFFFCTPESALPWLRTNETLSSDELALLILGSLPITTSLKSSELTLPFVNSSGQQVLIACSLVQFGEKHIQAAKLDPHRITQDQCTMVALTVWKADWDDEAWSHIVQNPYKFVKNLPGAEEAISSLWGKSYRRGKQVTAPRDATSIQMHTLIKDGKIHQFLVRTGHNLVWATPKMESGRPSDKWKLIWLDDVDSIPKASVITAKMPDACGLVRSKSRLAIRVLASKFEAAYASVYPNKPVPVEHDTSRLYKIEGLPFGTTQTMLDAWSKHTSWVMKPLRQLGARAWLIGTGSPPPQGQLSFNGMRILAREIQSKSPGSFNPVIAGPRNVRVAPQQNALLPLNGDPWAGWKGTGSSSSAAPLPRTVTGPSADRFAEQDTKIQHLESAINEIKAASQEQAAKLDKVQQEGQSRDRALRSHMDQSLADMKQGLDTAFAAALNQQSKKFDTSLTEIKNLLLAKPKRKQPEEEDEDMK